jgi:hypothetical protein
MAKLKGLGKSRGANILKSGMTKQEIIDRTDKLRQEMLALLIERGPTSLRVVAGKLGISYDASRAYGNHLVICGAAIKEKIGLDTYFSATGGEYKHLRKSSHAKAPPPDRENTNPHMRTIKLLDRKPEQISKQEHNAARRSSTISVRGSSMSMFDGY